MSVREAIEDVLFEEAALLDAGAFDAWLGLLAADVTYRMPVRMTRERGQAPDASDEMQHFWEDRATLQLRVDRLRTEFAWAEDPPSRTRHFVSNIRVRPAGRAGEFDVSSYLLVYRSRGDLPADLISAERRDVWRETDAGWRLAARRILIDQATLATKNLGIFL